MLQKDIANALRNRDCAVEQNQPKTLDSRFWQPSFNLVSQWRSLYLTISLISSPNAFASEIFSLRLIADFLLLPQNPTVLYRNA
jgi:hypothetical protein